MTDVWQIPIPDEARTRLLAEIIATKLAAGMMVTLQGDLGAGKTTFSRYLIRALLGDDAAEVPSPTFTLLQSYETPRFAVRHFDLYRIGGIDELDELAFDDADTAALTLVEWPERAGDLLGASRLDIMISDTDDANDGARHIAVAATPDAEYRLSRIRAAYDFCCARFDAAALARLRFAYLQGDASTRSYARLHTSDGVQILMDMPRQPDGPVIADGKTYSEIAHLAEDAGPFVAIASALKGAGIAVPSVGTFDDARGMALIEDFGDVTFGAALEAGVAQDDLWLAAVDVLLALRRSPPPAVVTAGDVRHVMPAYDASVMRAEIGLLADWYWPYVKGLPVGPAHRAADVVAELDAVWAPLIDEVATAPDNVATTSWVLRDFHSPNLLWRPERDGLDRVGVIDFQDAQIGHAAYDLMSLALDARLDVPRALHDALLDAYCAGAAKQEQGFDAAAFRRAAAILGAQRGFKLLGLFVRLPMRDGKHEYSRHIPRIRRYLSWCLAHPDLADLKAWYGATLLPEDL